MQQEILFQKYRIIRLLGRGGTAKVYLAEHIKLNSFRAIKCISKNHPSYELQLKEAQILKNLKHSCIPTIYDIEEDEDCSYIVEQYLEGETLRDYVGIKGRISENIIISFALQICDLIQYLHKVERPVLYLDLKPENIIVTGRTVKLVDFGSAVYQDEADSGQDFYGTRGYAAPELYRHGSIDERTDVYSIGMLLYYMVAETPISGNLIDNIDFKDSCPKYLKKIINRCLQYNPSQRYASVTQLIKQLSAKRIKNRFHSEAGKSLSFAVAGAQARIGVTHLAFRLCSYFIHQDIDCLYLEKNKSHLVHMIKSRYEGMAAARCIFEPGGFPMLGADQAAEDTHGGCIIKVKDYGSLTTDNLAEFLEADVKILVLGAKDWELEPAEQVLLKVAEYKDIVYLFNFLDGRQYKQVVKSMDRRNCMRIPYEPDPFKKPVDISSLELFRELYRLALYEIKQTDKSTFNERNSYREKKADTI